MSRLPITIATSDYDRVRALTDGRVRVEGCDVNYITMPVEECFERAFFHHEFEVAEIGFSPHLIALSRGPTPYVAVPVFLSRMFRHSAVYIRTDRGIRDPADLRGKRIGVPEYQMSAVMWFRGYLQDEYGVTAKDIDWVQAGLENPGRKDKFPLNLPEGFPLVSRNALKIGLPWITAEYEATTEAMGSDFWSYGVEPNRKTLSTMARYSFEQGLAVRLLTAEEMFAEGNLSETRV